jgi:hypothetical protein
MRRAVGWISLSVLTSAIAMAQTSGENEEALADRGAVVETSWFKYATEEHMNVVKIGTIVVKKCGALGCWWSYRIPPKVRVPAGQYQIELDYERVEKKCLFGSGLGIGQIFCRRTTVVSERLTPTCVLPEGSRCVVSVVAETNSAPQAECRCSIR